MLTTGVDLIPGMNGSNGNAVNSGNDLIVAFDSAAATATLNAFDLIDAGEGTDTLRVISDSATGILLNNVSNVEIIEVQNSDATDGNTIDTSDLAGVTNLIVTRSASDFSATAADTTDISFSGAKAGITIEGGKNVVVNDATADEAITIGATTGAVGTITVTDTKQGTGDIAVDGGTDVTITATASADLVSVGGGDIDVGQDVSPIAPTGAVKITQNLNATGGDNDVDDLTGGDITVTGGKTVEITINATSTATKAAADGDIVIGTTTVTGDSKTTDVTVTQNASVTTFTTPVVAAVADQTVVTFKAMTAGQTAVVNGLTFTASKALTAEQAAAAFANLGTADTQDKGGPTANGIYSGASNTAAYTSGAASGATVTFTAAAGTGNTLALTGAALPTKVHTAGSLASGGGAPTSNTVTLGDVVVDDNATEAIKTITLNGFKDATLGVGGSLDALTTLNLTNSVGDTALTSTSATLAVTLNDIDGGDLDLGTTAAVETLTLTTTGEASDIDLTADALKSLTIDAGVDLTLQTGAKYDDVLETVVVKGAGAVDLGNISAAGVGAGKLKSFSAADNKGGVTVSVSAKTADVAATFDKYVLSQGNDNVTLVDAVVNKAIELGAGDDTITLDGGTTSLAANIDGGTGSNTLVMDSADAAGASVGTTFEAKISGFDKLGLNAVAATAQDAVNLDNLDDIKYVISAGTTDAAQVKDLTLTVDTPIMAGNTVSVTINGTTYTTLALIGGETPTAVAAAIATAVGGAYNVAAAAGVLTFTSANGGATVVSGLTVNQNGGGGVGAVSGVEAVTSSQLTLDNLLDGGTLELAGAGTGAVVNMKDATGTADVLNLVTTDLVAAAGNVGTVVANGVETINITTTDTFVDDGTGNDTANSDVTLAVTSDKLTKVNVTGAGDIDLVAIDSTLEEVDASTLEGVLTFTAAVNELVVKGGTAADDLTANADDVALYGGAGDDTLTVDGGLRVNLYGGEGADTFVISAGASSTLDAYTVINGVDSGDVIELTGANKFSASKIALSLGADETLLNYANQAIKTLAEGEMGWFQRGGNTYIVQDVLSSGTNSDAFTAGEDMIVMIVGLVDLGTGASYNGAGNNILEIV